MSLVVAAVMMLAIAPGYSQSALTTSFNHFSTGFPLTGAHSSVDCTSCHRNGRFKGTPKQCFACHNGANAQGKPSRHPQATNFCEGCHLTAAWRDLRFIDHVQTNAPCASCHNGTIALGKPVNHLATAAQCNTCHQSTVSYSGAATIVNHAGFTQPCATCHNGVAALGKPANHIQTTLPCESCHKSTTTWLGAIFAHAATDTNCSSCHNGSGATGLTTPPHIPVTGVECSNCHTNTAPSFTTYTMGVAGHTAVSASRCDTCHNGSYTGEGTKGALGTASFPGHVPTNGRDCIICHTTAASAFTTWQGGSFAHAATDTNCSSCHNGTTATGLTTPPHIPVTGVQCSNCHTNTAPSFTTYTMGVAGHTAVSASRCDACHNGSYTGEGTKGALGTASFPGHVPTNGRDCITCHTTAASAFTTWQGGSFAHAATDTNCSSCHNGTTATGLTTPPHIPVTGVQCSNCHTNTAPSFTTYTMGVAGHTAVSASRCDACHNGSYTGEGTKGALGTASFPGHVATNGRDCVTCHTTAASAYSSWQGGTFAHAATDTNCSSCHNGTTATGMTTPPHIPATGVQCSNCHTNTAPSFTTYTMGVPGHTAVSASRCDSCHNGSYTSQGTKGALGTASFPGHVATNGRDCVTCHTTAASAYSSWQGGTFAHAATDTNCSSCHNGTTATGMTTPPHIPVTGVQCSNCHSNTAPSFTTYTMNHTSVSASRCDSCHNGSYTGEGTKGALGTASFSGHVATNGTDCVTCHASAASTFTSWAGGKYTHAATDTNCSSCHNGTTATGMTTPPHIPVTGVQCSNCHTNTASSFTTYTMSHAAVTASRCDSCHNGSYTSQGTKGAQGKSSDHPKTTADCGCCHTSTTSFDQQRSSPAGCTTTATATAASATTSTAAAKTGTTTATTTTLATTTTSPTTATKTGTITATTTTAATATTSPTTATKTGTTTATTTTLAASTTSPTTATKAGTATATTTTLATATTSPTTATRPATAMTTAAPVAVAQSPGAAAPNSAPPNAAPSNPGVSGLPASAIQTAPTSPNRPTASARPNHAGITSGCAACHNGIAAPGRPPSHIVTNMPCENCHKNTVTFAGARMNHIGISANCVSCHNGRAAIGKPVNHIVTNAPCETCHKSTVTFAGAQVDHTRLTAPCASCHNGTMAERKPPTHFVTTLPCEACHRTQLWTPVTYRHTSPAFVNHGPGLSCISCHTSNAQMVPWKFPAYRPDCAGCHADKYRPMSHPKFERPVKVYYTVAELRDCTGACHIYTDNTQRTILSRQVGVHRAIGGGW